MQARRSERGDSLIEVLLALVILGIAGTALLGAFGTGVFSAGLHRQQTDAGAVLASAVESVLDPIRNPYVDCATTTTYNPLNGVRTPSVNWQIAITSVSWWDGQNFVTSPNPNTCRPGDPDAVTGSNNNLNPFHLQLISISITTPAGVIYPPQPQSLVKLGP